MAFSPLATSQHFGHAGREAPLFQPSKSPASIATSPAFATADESFGGSRKRQRGESTRQETPSWSRCPTPNDRIFNSAYGQNSGLVNEKYRLAGGFDTPLFESTQRLEQLTVNEHEFRRRLRDDDMGNTLRSDDAPIFGPLARERNGMPRIPTSSQGSDGPQKTWTNVAFGLVGKVFTFGTSVIKGFYAGGGQGYDLNGNYPLVGSDLLQEGARTPIPGSWYQDEFLGDFEQDSPAFARAQTPTDAGQNKRRQTERDTWVVVGTPDLDESMLSPKRKATSTSVTRNNPAGRPTASRASSRRSLAPTPRRGNPHVTANGSPAQPQLLSPTHNRRASFAPTRSPQGRPSMSQHQFSYVTPEAERYAKRQAKQDRAADKAMNSMGKRMEDLIKQAQEALGTKFSVDGGDGMELEDEGYDDDAW